MNLKVLHLSRRGNMRTFLVGDLMFSKPQSMTTTTSIQMLSTYDSLTASMLAFKAKKHWILRCNCISPNVPKLKHKHTYAVKRFNFI